MQIGVEQVRPRDRRGEMAWHRYMAVSVTRIDTVVGCRGDRNFRIVGAIATERLVRLDGGEGVAQERRIPIIERFQRGYGFAGIGEAAPGNRLGPRMAWAGEGEIRVSMS